MNILRFLWNNIIYKYYYVEYLFGEVHYGSKEFLSYDFSRYEEKRIVGVSIGLPDTREQMYLEALKLASEKFNCSVEDLKEKCDDSIILDNFYMKNVVIPQNRFTKKYGLYQGGKIWTQL